jgi:hypothetical protein
MATKMTDSARADLFIRACLSLGGQGQLGAVLGVSRRTVNRWDKAHALTTENAKLLAKAIHPQNPSLAGMLADFAGVALWELGLGVKPPDPFTPPKSHVVESVLCAAAEAFDTSPRAMRAALLAAFERAEAMRLDVATVVAGLRAQGEKSPKARASR